jgi:hypothetical protein
MERRLNRRPRQIIAPVVAVPAKPRVRRAFNMLAFLPGLRRTLVPRRRPARPAARGVHNRQSDRVSSTTIGSGSRARVSSHEADTLAEVPAIRVLTLNAHQGFSATAATALQIRDGLRTAGADLVFCRKLAVRMESKPRHISTRFWPNRFGRSTRTGATQ